MNRPDFLVYLALLLLLWAGSASSNILVIAPHPDDDVITAAGVTYAARLRGEQVTVVYVTNGDFQRLGDLRQDEAVDAQITHLATRESDLIFLGYPDGSLINVYDNFPLQTDRFLGAASGHTTTYAHRGLGATDYHNYRFGSHANYNRFNLIKDLQDIIATQRPEHIVTVTEFDEHDDHVTTYNATRDAVQAVTAANPSYIPVLNKTTVWSTNSMIWPENANPQTYFNEPPGLAGTGLVWDDRASLDVPLAMQVTDVTNPKAQAIDAHASQGGTGDFIGKFLHKDEFFWPVTFNGGNFPPRVNAGVDQSVAQGSTVILNGSGSQDPDGGTLRYQWRQIAGPTVSLANATTSKPNFIAPSGSPIDRTLVFELRVNDGILNTLPDHVSVRVLGTGATLPNIAPLAAVTASSQNSADSQQASKAIDGVADGYPGDYTREWVTVGEGANAWIQLNWNTPYEVYRVVLHDRPNLDDMITSATLTFSDGATLTVGALDNAGAGVEFNVGPFITNSLRVTVKTVSGDTQNIGLSELKVYGIPPTGGNIAPVANAGSAQTVAQGVTVNLNGNASSDPEGKPITFRWTQTAGPNVTLTDANTAAPSFTAPVDLTAPTTLTFALIVNDGLLDSAPDTVNVTITAATGTGTNIAPLATVTASSQNTDTNQQAVKAVDGIADGYPGDFTREWATINETVGAWLQLTWSTFYRVDHVILYDRPNTSDQITGATLTFSDNSTVTVGALNNTGVGTVVNFTPRLTTGLKVTVTTVSGATGNVGLSEIGVYGILPAGGNLAPVAHAGADQNVNLGSTVFLDGRLSADPNNDPLTYQWTQTVGPSVSLTGANTSTPTFSAPSNLTTTTVLTFALVVNDGQVNSTVDSVNITVSPATNIAALATVTASSQNTSTNQQAINAVDGVADGYPGDFTKEWATVGQGVGAWIQLNWNASYQIDHVVLYDRPNTNDQITGATLTFSDNSTVTVGALNNTGTGVVINFPPKLTTSVRITVTTVSGTTTNVGLSEIEVHKILN